jgi:predicted  nucleic acid-binding Zn-ribbon protein/G:T-mismatch repair DNA endonuclease (very short patch repair protein)
MPGQDLSYLKDKFVEKAIRKHGDKCLYNLVNYINCKEKVCIVCTKHGEFYQTPDCHISGNGCPKCGKESSSKKQRSSPEEFLQRAHEIHGEEWEYPDIANTYANAKTAIPILCFKHGIFDQTPDNHLAGSGCPKCGVDTTSKKLTKHTQETMFAAYREKHGETYSYKKSVYRGIDAKIIIGCPKHGDFEQIAVSHLKYGCFSCASEARGLERRSSKDMFVAKANQLHGIEFDYSEYNYTTNITPSTIICQTHGKFEMSPAQHLRKRSGGGKCPQCRLVGCSKGELQWISYIKVSNPDIIYKLQGGQHIIEGTRYRADGFIPETNEVLEFQGCYYHGCPTCMPDRSKINTLNKLSFQELYDRTIERKKIIHDKGYKYREMWQCEWENAIEQVKKIQKKFRFRKAWA